MPPSPGYPPLVPLVCANPTLPFPVPRPRGRSRSVSPTHSISYSSPSGSNEGAAAKALFLPPAPSPKLPPAPFRGVALPSIKLPKATLPFGILLEVGTPINVISVARVWATCSPLTEGGKTFKVKISAIGLPRLSSASLLDIARRPSPSTREAPPTDTTV